MKKAIISTLLFSFGILSIQGQNKILEKINAIKAQRDVYLWHESSGSIADSAIANATRALLLDAMNECEKILTLEQVSSVAKHIKMNRGTQTRAFVYIKKSDLDYLDAFPSNSSLGTQLGVNRGQNSMGFVPDAFVQKIWKLKEFYTVYKWLREQKLDKQVLQFGSLKEVEDYSSLDLILFDKQSREILAILSGETQGKKRVNLMDGTEDSLDNYPDGMLYVIWYIR